MATETLKALCAKFKIKLTFSEDTSPHEDWPAGSSHYIVTLELRGRKIRTKYGQGPALCHDPRVEDVLGSLLLDGRMGQEAFADFCNELGYDADSRKAYASWEECVTVNHRLDTWFADGELRERFERSEQP